MHTKQLLLGLLCAAAALPAQASLDWIGGDNSVHVEFNYYTFFNTYDSAEADVYEVIDEGGNSLAGGVAGQDAPDMVTLGGHTSRYSDAGEHWLETTANYDLSLWTPALSGYETQLFCVQIAYFAYYDGVDYDLDWRQNYDLGLELYYDEPGETGQISAVTRASTVDAENYLVIETFTFAVENAADGLFIDIAADPGLSVDNPSYIVWMEVDSVSYDAVPEPSTYGLLAGLGVLGLIIYRRRLKAYNNSSL